MANDHDGSGKPNREITGAYLSFRSWPRGAWHEQGQGVVSQQSDSWPSEWGQPSHGALVVQLQDICVVVASESTVAVWAKIVAGRAR